MIINDLHIRFINTGRDMVRFYHVIRDEELLKMEVVLKIYK